MIMNSKIYDALKTTALIILPAVSVLYVTLAGIWGWPLAEAIAGTIAGIETFLGALLKISSNKYAQENQEGEK